MSYDLTFIRVPDGADAEVIYQQLVEQEESECAGLPAPAARPISDAAPGELSRIARILKSWRPSLVEFESGSPIPWIELDDDDLAIQFQIHDSSISINMPYFRERAHEMMSCVIGSLELLKVEGYSAYDPQLGRVITGADIDEMVAQYRGIDRVLPEIHAHSRKITAGRQQPWWKFW